MGKTELLFVATAALTLCICRSAIIQNDVNLQSNLVICPNPADKHNELQVDTEINETGRTAVTERTLNYPEEGFFQQKITCILIEDLFTDGEGGSASIIEGGLNARRLTIKLRSLPEHGLRYKIQIYTYK